MAENFREVFDKAWTAVAAQMANLIPKLLVGIAILLLGLLIARLIRTFVFRIFLAIRLDRMSDRLGISAFLARGDTRYTVAETLATLVYWVVFVFALGIMSQALGLDGVSAFMGRVVGYLPRLAVALAIIVVGLVVGSFIGGAVQVTAANASFPAARQLGRAVKYMTAFFALVMALEQLQIGTRFLATTLDIAIGAVALAFALAFGLGCQDLARDAVRNWLSKGRSEQEAADKDAKAPTGR